MPGFKVLNRVAHNLGCSFTSLMNYTVDDYAMGHLLRFARESGNSTLTIDLLSGTGGPAALLREPISELPSWYSMMFLTLVKTAGSDRQLIQSATLTVNYDLLSSQPSPTPGEPQNAYTRDVSIVDIHGKHYVARFDGWWFIQRTEVNRRRPSASPGPRPLTWFQSSSAPITHR
jgi:hypothetical protein